MISIDTYLGTDFGPAVVRVVPTINGCEISVLFVELKRAAKMYYEYMRDLTAEEALEEVDNAIKILKLK